MKKLLALVLAVVLTLSVFAGCTPTVQMQGTPSTPSTPNNNKPPVVNTQVNSDVYPLDSDEVFDVIFYGDASAAGVAPLFERITGVEINYLEYTEEQYQMVTMGGSLPDACYRNYGYDKAALFEMGDAGLIIDFTDYLDIMPNFAQFLDRYPVARFACTNEDGSIYCLPTMFETAGSQSNLVYVRADMARAAGWETMPTTVEELMQMSLDIQKTFAHVEDFCAVSWTSGPYLELNNVIDNTLFPAFGELVDVRFTANSKNEVVLGAATEQYRHYVKYMSDWYKSGAVWKEAYADDGTMAKAKCSAGEVAIAFGSISGVTKEHFESGEFEILILDPLTSSVWDVEQFRKAPSGNISCNSWISTSCKDIETMCRWFDAFFSTEDNPLNKEGTVWGVSAWLGEIGVDTIVVEETEHGKGYEQPNGTPAGAYFYQFMGATNFYSAADSLFGIKCDAMINQLLPLSKETPLVTELPKDEDDQEEYDNAWIDMKKYINESTAKFITGQWDVDTMWDSYINTLESMGMSDICELLQPYYTDYIK
ncbi:MAG: hypothetical protein E7447_01860 [Ruminococcaceae bacterium]|nr:hypothetical protein [Oscillospiraceae bacterium]